METMLTVLSGNMVSVLRFLFPVLAVWIVIRCGRSLLSFEKNPETWGFLKTDAGEMLPLNHWENMIGRKKSCDVRVDFPTISRTHAVLTRYDDGSWSVRDAGSKTGTTVNGEALESCEVCYGDVISVGGYNLTLTACGEITQKTTGPDREVSPGFTLFLLTVFQVFAAFALIASLEDTILIAASFGFLIAVEWVLFLLLKIMRKSGYDVETAAFFLTTIGVAVCASNGTDGLLKEMVCICLGLLVFLAIGWSLRSLSRAKTIRYIAAAVGLLLLAANVLFGSEIGGAKNWIVLGGFSFQPSEFVKICFIFTGASTLERVVAKRNVILFLIYTGVICLALAWMSDFGTAVIFFTAYLAIAFLRSGNFASIVLLCAAVLFAGFLLLKFYPYAQSRLAAWGHVWEDPLNTGYQQTRSMMCIASGGLLGLGPGNGWLKYVAASETDLVFAFVSEEWGLIVACSIVVMIALLGLFTVKVSSIGRSTFYTIGACAAACIFMVQVVLNLFGTVDFLPLTGVTFPFVSQGGSSMISTWGLLAFMKAADTRKNASFAVKKAKPVSMPKSGKPAKRSAEEAAT